MRLNGDLQELVRLTAAVEEFCRDRGIGPDVEFDLNLALEELFTNALRHGGCAGMTDAVEVRLTDAPDGVRICFRDRGLAFDPLSTADPPNLDSPLEHRPAGGLGLHLVRSVMRDLTYERAGDWNCVGMRRAIEERG